MANRSNDLLRYELFGWDYEAINPLGEDEFEWYRYWADRIKAPILGLACGSARLLIALAQAGHTVAGIDLSETMLTIASDHVEQQPPEVRRRIRLLRQDMARLKLDQQFGLALIPDNSFRELPTRRQLLACVRGIHRYLQPEGKLLIVERRFQSKMYPGGVRSFEWSEPKQNPRTGELVRRKVDVRLHRDHRRLSGSFEYEVMSIEGRSRTVRCPWSAPVLQLDEYPTLFKRAGFDTQVFSDYRLEPSEEPVKLWCFVCSKP